MPMSPIPMPGTEAPKPPLCTLYRRQDCSRQLAKWCGVEQ